MDMSKLEKLKDESNEKMAVGDFEGALRLAHQIRSLDRNYLVSYVVSAYFIDIGTALGDEKLVEEGVELLVKDFEKIEADEKYAPTAYYNLGNGYSSVFHFKKKKDLSLAFFKESELNKAKDCYRKALEYDIEDSKFASQIFVNLGNCFDQLGRVVDALECYEDALKLKPDHGMALCNKGVALFYYAGMVGEHQGTFMLEAHSLISQGFRFGVNPEAVHTFNEYLEGIKAWFSDRKVLDESPKFPGLTVKADLEFEKFLIEFCLKNRLYLNVCNYCQKCDAAIGDPVAIQKMIVKLDKSRIEHPFKDDPFLTLSAYLNQIKQDYITARFLLIMSRYKGIDLDFVDKRVRIIDTLDYSMHSIYIQLLKASFKCFYDILDKIAHCIDEYLEIGTPETKIDFRRVWYSEPKKEKIHKKILGTKNFGLNALFDMHNDFETGPYRRLRETRHALTHRFVNVRMFQKEEDAENMTEQTLLDQTLELARLARNAIIYLLQFIHVEENKKETGSKGAFPPMFALELPDDLKSWR